MSARGFRGVPASKVTRLGYIPTLFVCGPFEVGGHDGWEKAYHLGRLEFPAADPLGSEVLSEPVPGKSYVSDELPEGSTPWKTVSLKSQHIDFSSLFAPQRLGMVYAASYVVSPDDQLLVFDFQPVTAVILVLNGHVVSPAGGLVQIPLRAGRNLLIAKIIGTSNTEPL